MSSIWKLLLIAELIFALSDKILAKDVPINVLPWNGYKAALSMTYDDGDPIHLEVAAPELAKRGLRATFFLITSRLDPLVVGEWKKVLSGGQEIGNHTVTHRHTSELTSLDEQNEVEKAKQDLEKDFGVPVLTFAYPFVEESPGLKKWVESYNFIARGGGGGGNYYLTPDMEPDWFDIPGQATMTAYAFETYKNWVDQDLAAGAWTVMMIHGIQGTPWGYQPIPKKTYLLLLDYLVQNQKNIWIAPFGEIGSYWRAEKTLEQSEPQRDGGATKFNWVIPSNFPKGVTLKVKIEGKNLMVSQGDQEIKPLSQDIYPVAFDMKELTLKNVDWVPQESHSGTEIQNNVPAVIDPNSIMAVPDKPVLKVDDFESSSPLFGGAWWESCDPNGATKLSPSPFVTLVGGSPESPGHCAGMKGHMGPQQVPWPWAALSLNLSTNGGPVDLSAYKAIRFYTKGDGKTHTVALNKASVTDYGDFQASFVSPSEWTQITINFSDFNQPNWGKQLEKKFNDVMKLTFAPGVTDPDFDFKIDDVEFIK